MSFIGGYQVVESLLCVHQFRFPRSKKRRIRKKWAKRPENWRPNTTAWFMHAERTVVMHPTMARALREQAKKAGLWTP